jgi:hypothetical protein
MNPKEKFIIILAALAIVASSSMMVATMVKDQYSEFASDVNAKSEMRMNKILKDAK